MHDCQAKCRSRIHDCLRACTCCPLLVGSNLLRGTYECLRKLCIGDWVGQSNWEIISVVRCVRTCECAVCLVRWNSFDVVGFPFPFDVAGFSFFPCENDLPMQWPKAARLSHSIFWLCIVVLFISLPGSSRMARPANPKTLTELVCLTVAEWPDQQIQRETATTTESIC